MKQVNVTKQFGNFNIAIAATLTEEQLDAVLKLGVLYVMERGPSSNTEKEVFGKDWEEGKKGGKIRPKGFDRGAAAYTEALAEEVRAAFQKQDAKLENAGTIAFEVTGVTEHVGGEGGVSRKMATAFVDQNLAKINKIDDDTTRTLHRGVLVGMLGLAEENEETYHSYDDLVEAAHAKFFAKK